MFSKPQIEELFGKFVTVRLFTDRVPTGVHQLPDADGSRDFRDEMLKNYALPYYVVLRAKGKTLEKIAAYDQGVIDSPEEFAAFLERALRVGPQW